MRWSFSNASAGVMYSSSSPMKQQHQTHSLELKANVDENFTSMRKDLCVCVWVKAAVYTVATREKLKNRLHQMCIKQVVSSPFILYFLLKPILVLWASAAANAIRFLLETKKNLKVSNHVCLLAFMLLWWVLLLKNLQRCSGIYWFLQGIWKT